MHIMCIQEPTEISIGQPYYVTKFSGRKRSLKKRNQFLHQDIEVGPIESTTQYTEFHEYICDKIIVSMEEKIDQ